MYKNISPNVQHVLLRLLYGEKMNEWRENLVKNNVVGRVLLDLSKVFDCFPQDFLLSNFAAYGVDESFLCYLYSYLLNWEQCARNNKINSEFLNVISGVSQRSVVFSIQFHEFKSLY